MTLNNFYGVKLQNYHEIHLMTAVSDIGLASEPVFLAKEQDRYSVGAPRPKDSHKTSSVKLSRIGVVLYT